MLQVSDPPHRKRPQFEVVDLPPEFRKPRAHRSKIARGSQSYHAGLAAEDIAARYYAARSAAILARRWRCGKGEIDLIIREPDCLVFVEVKARKRPLEDDPVSEKQWQRLEIAAIQYTLIAETGSTPLRFDLAVIGRDGNAEVIKNARH